MESSQVRFKFLALVTLSLVGRLTDVENEDCLTVWGMDGGNQSNF